METGAVVKSTKEDDVTHPSEETGGSGKDDLKGEENNKAIPTSRADQQIH